jgi:hypothetical protein
MTPAKIAPLAVALCSDASATVTGQVFAVRNNEIFLMSQPRPVRSVHRGEGWTPESVAQHALPALQAGVPDGGWLPLIRTLGEPLVASKLRDIADIEQAAVEPAPAAHEVDANILGRVVKNGVYVLTAAAAAAPDAPALVEIALERGVPVAINDVTMPLMDLIEILSIIAGQHGVGRVEAVEAPAAVVLEAALRAATDGVVRMKLFKGTCEQVAQLVAHE